MVRPLAHQRCTSLNDMGYLIRPDFHVKLETHNMLSDSYKAARFQHDARILEESRANHIRQLRSVDVMPEMLRMMVV
jgi:hypothetical protein